MKLNSLIPTENKLVDEFNEIEVMSINELSSIKGGTLAACEDGCKDSCKSGSKNVICGGSCAEGGKKADSVLE